LLLIELSPPQRPATEKRADRKTRGGWEERKIKARGERWEGKKRKEAPTFSVFPSFLAFPFSPSSAPAPVFFFHWCLPTGASAEQRANQQANECINLWPSPAKHWPFAFEWTISTQSSRTDVLDFCRQV